MFDKFLDVVTVTGADSTTSITWMEAIQEEFPFVEWGILMDKGWEGAALFPKKSWINLLAQRKADNPKLRLSAHLCGEYVTDFLLGRQVIGAFPEEWQEAFSRWQINTHGIPHEYNFEKLLTVLKMMRDRRSHKVIFQLDHGNAGRVLSLLKQAEKRGLTDTACALLDNSHGAGTLPSSWSTVPVINPTGYAGGLCGENVKENLEKIQFVTNTNRFNWIDAESRLRRNGELNSELVREYLSAAAPYVR